MCQYAAICNMYVNVIVIYVLETNIPTKLYIYSIHLKGIYRQHICIHIPDMTPLASTMWSVRALIYANDNAISNDAKNTNDNVNFWWHTLHLPNGIMCQKACQLLTATPILMGDLCKQFLWFYCHCKKHNITASINILVSLTANGWNKRGSLLRSIYSILMCDLCRHL